MIRGLNALDRLLAKLEQAVAVVALLGLVLVLIAQVLFRYVLLSPLFFAEELAVRLMIIVTFVGLSLLAHHRRLVAVDLLGGQLGTRARRLLDRVVKGTVLAGRRARRSRVPLYRQWSRRIAD